MAEGPLERYRALVRDGALKPDPVQEEAARRLQELADALAEWRPDATPGGWKARLGLARRRAEAPKGLYLHGPVGRGKSMLMDLFFETAPVAARRRVHFHEFMIEVHDFVHRWRREQTERGRGTEDPMTPAAEMVAERARLLCFDEFRVTNIADAMILARLFGALFERGVVVVATSNVALADLYKGGLQRERFLPFLDVFAARVDLLGLDSGTDYRLARLKSMKTYHAPLDARARAAMDKAFADLTEGARVEPDELNVKGRVIRVPAAARGVARFSFAELCDRPLGAEDYIRIAERFHTLLLDGVPRLTEDRRNEAHRFMTLVDALYEHNTSLVMSAEVPPHDLQRGESHGFEFQRTVSRLMEMQSAEYREAAHRPEGGARQLARAGKNG